MDRFTYFEIRRDKGRHPQCKQGVYKEGFEYYLMNWPDWEVEGCWDWEDMEMEKKKEMEMIIHNNCGCDNCVELWLRDDPNLKSKYKNNQDMIKPQEGKGTIEEKEKIEIENNVLKEENQKLKTEKEELEGENKLLKEENQKLKSDLNIQKNSIKNFISSFESDIHENLLQELNHLNDIIEQSKGLNFKEIRNLKLSEESCTSDQDYYIDYICSVCLDIVENPVNCSKCEKLNCRECINFNQACPNCQEGNVYNEAPIPRLGKNTLSNLNFLCPLGCSQKFKYEFKERHFTECANKERIPSKCSLCFLTLNEDLKSHSKKCDKLNTRCPYCNVEMSKLDLDEHMKECKCFIRPCGVCKVGFPSIYQEAHSDYYCNKIVALKKKIQDFIQSI